MCWLHFEYSFLKESLLKCDNFNIKWLPLKKSKKIMFWREKQNDFQVNLYNEKMTTKNKYDKWDNYS